MTKKKLEELVEELTRQMSTQSDLLAEFIRQQFIQPQEEIEPEPEPDLEPVETPMQRRLRTLREFILESFRNSPRQQNPRLPDYEKSAKSKAWEQLGEVPFPLFCGLVSKYLDHPLAEAIIGRTITNTLFTKTQRFIDMGLDTAELEIDTEVEEKAAAFAEAIKEQSIRTLQPSPGVFRLPGRQELEQFFNDHVVDLVNNHAAYRALGIDFPASFILEGPPGCGKTYAVERLAEHLGWPTHRITSGTIGSTYIHGTAKKIEEVFDSAAKDAPSIVIIDEMDAFMSERPRNDQSGEHRCEEGASFLRCLQDAARKRILVIGMTNLMENIDPAIKRTGRMGTHISVGMPSQVEVEAVLLGELAHRAHEEFAPEPLVRRLLDRPLSDITAAVNTAAMAAARARRTTITAADLHSAITTLDTRCHTPKRRSLGFAIEA